MLATSPTARNLQTPNSANPTHTTVRNGKDAISTQLSYCQPPVTARQNHRYMSRSPSSTHARSLKNLQVKATCVEASNQHISKVPGMASTITTPRTAAGSTNAADMEWVQESGFHTVLNSGITDNHQSGNQSPNTKRRQALHPNGIESQLTSPPLVSKRPKISKEAPKVLPLRYELCEVDDIVILIADMISELIETNDNLPLRDVVLTRFHSRTPPGISVIDYLQRLAKHAALTPPLLLSMVYYIDRLCSLYPAFTITTLTVHRFLITAATVAAKGLSDSFWNNTTYARVGGIKLAELGMLELEFLYRVDWRIVPNPEILVDYYRGLVSRSGDYVIETGTHEDESPVQTPVNASVLSEPNPTPKSVDGSKDHSRTESKWEKWMKDVAHTSNVTDSSVRSIEYKADEQND